MGSSGRCTLGLFVLLAAACGDTHPHAPAANAGAGGSGGSTGGAGAAGAGGTGGGASPAMDAAIEPDATVLDAQSPAAHDAAMLDASDGSAVPALDASESPTAVYSTEYWSGGRNHLMLRKLDAQRGYCVELSIAWPGGMAESEVEVPAGWGLEHVQSIETTDTCDRSEASPDGGSYALQDAESARGVVAFRDPDALVPCGLRIDIDVVVTFATTDPVPASDHLVATDLAVECE